MYIRKVTHTDQRNRQDYHTFKLVESVRTGRGPRQRAILNWGSEFSLPEEQWKLRDLGFNKPATDAAIGVIAARLIAPGSERSAHVWLQDVTALDDLLGADFVNLSRDRVYKTADMLLRRRSEIEAHLRGREQSLFQLRETLILYDLTNTFFEGTGKYNGKAHFGHSKEKRTLNLPHRPGKTIKTVL